MIHEAEVEVFDGGDNLLGIDCAVEIDVVVYQFRSRPLQGQREIAEGRELHPAGAERPLVLALASTATLYAVPGCKPEMVAVVPEET